jgi:site-specific recombinase XerD
LFPSGQKQAGKFVPLAYSTYQNIIKKLIRAIGLNPDLYGTHSLRSAVPLEFFEKEGDIVTTSHMFGHRSTATTQIYVEEIAKKKASEMRTKYNFFD